MNFEAKAIPMTRQGLADALSMLQLEASETAALWAVFEVETAGLTQGFGFRTDRRPQILFERHIFRRETHDRFSRNHPELSGPPGAYGSIAAQYAKMERALELCRDAGLPEDAALKSASWGLGQVMGFNHMAAGFATAADMVSAMVDNEDAQLRAMCRFMTSNGLDAALREKNWEKFARKYNGPQYAVNKYDIQLQIQYARFSSGSLPDIEMRTAQAALLLLGFSPGKIDGVLGKRTRDAIKGFQIASGAIVSGELSGDTYLKLWEAAFAMQ